MATTANATLISSANPSIQFNKIQSRTRSNLLRFPSSSLSSSSSSSSGSGSLSIKCIHPSNGNGSNISEQNENDGLKNLLSGVVDARVDELLSREENRVLLDGLDKATQRVELAKRELEGIEKQEIEARKMKEYINQLETRAAEIAECQKELSEARALVAEAERSLEVDGIGDKYSMMTDTEREAMYKNEERLESIKAASVSAIIGTLAGLPISFTQVTEVSQLILPSAITFVSCALFGVTFRYAVRRDLDNFQLKTGTSAAFGFIKGLATLGGGPPLELETDSLLTHALNGAAYVSSDLLIFLFAAVGLDICFKLRILSPFPIERSV